MNFTHNYGVDPNYIGSTLKPVRYMEKLGPNNLNDKTQTAAPDHSMEQPKAKSQDHAQHTTPSPVFTVVTEKDFEQATALWTLMGKQDGAQNRFVGNAAAHIAGVTTRDLRERAYGMSFLRSSGSNLLTRLIEMFGKVDKQLGEKLRKTAETKIENNHEHPHKTAWH
jgi:catalase